MYAGWLLATRCFAAGGGLLAGGLRGSCAGLGLGKEKRELAPLFVCICRP